MLKPLLIPRPQFEFEFEKRLRKCISNTELWSCMNRFYIFGEISKPLPNFARNLQVIV